MIRKGRDRVLWIGKRDIDAIEYVNTIIRRVERLYDDIYIYYNYMIVIIMIQR